MTSTDITLMIILAFTTGFASALIIVATIYLARQCRKLDPHTVAPGGEGMTAHLRLEAGVRDG